MSSKPNFNNSNIEMRKSYAEQSRPGETSMRMMKMRQSEKLVILNKSIDQSKIRESQGELQ